MKNYDEALQNFEKYIQKNGINDNAQAYYYLGLMQFYKEDYEKSLNSLELSLDLSKDPGLDKKTESLIDKVVQHQNYFEKNPRTHLSFLLGYNRDFNTINLSPNSVTENVSGHVFNYGIAASYKVINRYSFVIEPGLVIFDTYTLDSQFMPNSTLQGTDALQALLNVPVRFYNDSVRDSNRYDLSFSIYNIYLPAASSKRELSLSSYGLKAQTISTFSEKFSMKYGMGLSYDQSYGFSNEEDNASGIRYNLFTTLLQNLSDSSRSMFYELMYDQSGTKGINTRYQKSLAGAGYLYPSFWSTKSSVRLGAEHLNYPDKIVSRVDTQLNLSYNIVKELSDTSVLLFNMRILNNSSNYDIYRYNDAVIGLQYSKTFAF